MKYLISIILFSFLMLSCEGEKVLNSEETTKPGIQPEQFLLYKDFPSKYVDARNVEIWLPESYNNLDSLPVVYMFDGQNIFHGTKGWSGEYNAGWQVPKILDSLIQAEAIPPVMVVGVFNIGMKRGTEYMPAKPKDLIEKRMQTLSEDWYTKYINQQPESDTFLKFIVEELKPFVDANFKTKSSQANTYLAGSSMGGLISAYAICEYPHVFGGAACFSTHWLPLDGVFLEYIRENLPDPSNHKIYFDYGTEGLDAVYEPFQKIADSYLLQKGYEEDKNWKTLKVEGADHNEKAWRNRFHIPMVFLLN